jgi:hypothetical protein
MKAKIFNTELKKVGACTLITVVCSMSALCLAIVVVKLPLGFIEVLLL